MSTAAKQCIIILVVLLVGSIGFAAFSILEKQRLEQQGINLSHQLEESQQRENKSYQQIADLKKDLEKIQTQRDELQKNLDETQSKFQEISLKVQDLTKDRDQLKNQVEGGQKERTTLAQEIKKLNESVTEYKQKLAANNAEPVASVKTDVPTIEELNKIFEKLPSSDDPYWATVLKDKVALEIQINNTKEELVKRSSEILVLKQKNSEIQMQLENIQHEKDSIASEIKYKGQMIDDLSFELAKTKNGGRFANEKLSQLDQENAQLRDRMKALSDQKKALENSIVNLTNEKNKVSKEANKTEGLIQNKISEIWGIKDRLDKTVKKAEASKDNKKEVDLQPIVINPGSSVGVKPEENPKVKETKLEESAQEVKKGSQSNNPGFDGKIVSINEENNFVVVNLGEKSGIRLGDNLTVYRDAQYIARLEVIQVRKDIAAADLKDQWKKIRVGDIVR